eukprot:10117452-Karenia_brevis.AAC.1
MASSELAKARPPRTLSGGSHSEPRLHTTRCYEMINHADLMVEARELNYPIGILRLSIRSYTWARRMLMGGLMGDSVYASQ